MKKIAYLILPIVILLGCSKTDKSPTDSLFGEAMSYLEKYNYEAAESTFDKLAELEEGVPWIAFGKAIAFETHMQYYDALHMYMLMANTYPGFAHAHAGEWRMLTKVGQPHEALKAAITFNKLNPNYVETKLLYAEALIKADQPESSHKILDSALTLGADEALVSIMRAQAYARNHHYDSAETAYNEGLSKGELSYRSWIEAAEYLEAIGLIDSAMTASKNAFTLSGETPSTLWRYLDLTLRQGCFTTARKIRSLMEEKQFPIQILYAAEMWYEYARHENTKAKMALASYGNGVSERLSIWAFEIIIRGAAGDELTTIGNPGAIAAQMQQKGYDPDFQSIMKFMMAVEATQFLGDVIGIDQMDAVAPTYYTRPEYLTKMAQMYHGSGQERKFKEYFNRSFRYHGRQPDWLTSLGDIYAKFFDLSNDSAYYYYNTALEIDPYYTPALKNAVKLALKQRQYARVEKLYEQNDRITKTHPALIFQRAISLFESGKNDEGFTYLQEAHNRLPENYDWVIPIQNSLILREDMKMMTKIANWLASSSPDLTDAQLAAAQYLLLAGESAAEVTDRASVLEPTRLDVSAMKARVLYSEGKPMQAIAILEKNLVADRTHLMTNRYLGLFLAENGVDPAKSQNCSRYAVGLSGLDLSTWMDLCYVYHLAGRYALARGEGRKAMSYYPNRPEPFFWTGMSEYHLGVADGTIRLNLAIDKGLKGELLKTAKETLAKMK